MDDRALILIWALAGILSFVLVVFVNYLRFIRLRSPMRAAVENAERELDMDIGRIGSQELMLTPAGRRLLDSISHGDFHISKQVSRLESAKLKLFSWCKVLLWIILLIALLPILLPIALVAILGLGVILMLSEGKGGAEREDRGSEVEGIGVPSVTQWPGRGSG